MFEFIRQNKLYSKAGQQAFTQDIVVPEGMVKDGTTDGTIGAIMVKAAWTVLGDGDSPRKFHTTTALIYAPDQTCHGNAAATTGRDSDFTFVVERAQ